MAGIFQLTTSRRGRLMTTLTAAPLITLSTHDLTQRSTVRRDERRQYGRSFNSRPHAEVDQYRNMPGLHSCLSTHDLTQRSTVEDNHTNRGLDLSTHDLTQRSTGRGLSAVSGYHLSTHDLTQRSTASGLIPQTAIRLSTHDLTQRST